MIKTGRPMGAKNHATRERDAEIVRRRGEGQLPFEVAGAIGCTMQQMHSLLQRLGVGLTAEEKASPAFRAWQTKRVSDSWHVRRQKRGQSAVSDIKARNAEVLRRRHAGEYTHEIADAMKMTPAAVSQVLVKAGERLTPEELNSPRFKAWRAAKISQAMRKRHAAVSERDAQIERHLARGRSQRWIAFHMGMKLTNVSSAVRRLKQRREAAARPAQEAS